MIHCPRGIWRWQPPGAPPSDRPNRTGGVAFPTLHHTTKKTSQPYLLLPRSRLLRQPLSSSSTDRCCSGHAHRRCSGHARYKPASRASLGGDPPQGAIGGAPQRDGCHGSRPPPPHPDDAEELLRGEARRRWSSLGAPVLPPFRAPPPVLPPFRAPPPFTFSVPSAAAAPLCVERRCCAPLLSLVVPSHLRHGPSSAALPPTSPAVASRTRAHGSSSRRTSYASMRRHGKS
jgi:hypothetical protein